MKSFDENDRVKNVLIELEAVNRAYQLIKPGPSEARQPVHTVYGGAHLFRATTARRLSEMANASLATYAPDADTLCRALGLSYDDEFAAALYQRIQLKLSREAVEDFRIDFEDGFGNRPDDEEDEAARHAADELAKAMASDLCPPFIGIRIKPLNEELKRRSIRTLGIFLSRLMEKTELQLPPGFVVTLPKITHPYQVKALVEILEAFEQQYGLQEGALKLEIMVETPESILDESGACSLPRFITESRGRCRGAHFGTYDYTASLEITAAWQQMDHPACDFARHFMQVSLAGRGVFISDGATNLMPVGPHRGDDLSDQQKEENQRVVHGAWKAAFDHTRHSLKHAIYQGWDLHPAQFVVRYAAIYSFFLESLDAASTRLKNFMDSAAKATLSGDVFDDAATGQGLLNYFLRAYNCGAIGMEELLATGLTEDEIRTRSFLKILQMRKKLSTNR